MERCEILLLYLRSIQTTTGQSAQPYEHWQWSKKMETFKHRLSFANTDSTVSRYYNEESFTGRGKETEEDLDIEKIPDIIPDKQERIN